MYVSRHVSRYMHVYLDKVESINALVFLVFPILENGYFIKFCIGKFHRFICVIFLAKYRNDCSEGILSFLCMNPQREGLVVLILSPRAPL
jgi:hypothetical protein